MRNLLCKAAIFVFSLPLAACVQGDENSSEPAAPQVRRASQTPPTSDCQLVEGDVVIRSAADLVPFDQPGICFDITGSLFVQNTTDVADLSEFRLVRSVGGWVGISDNTALTSAGLSDLRTIGEGLVVEGNPQLRSVPLVDLEEVGGNLQIFNNPSLEALGEWPDLTRVGGQFLIAGNDALTALRMPALQDVADDFIVENNDLLPQVRFDGLETVGGTLRIAFNRGLESVILNALSVVADDIFIVRNPVLTALSFLAIESVGGDVRITDNQSLATCEVERLTVVSDPGVVAGRVVVGGNDDQTICPDPGQCTTFDGNFVVANSQALERFAELGCEVIDGDLIVEDTGLMDLDGLESLREVTGSISIVNNEALLSMSGLRNLVRFGFELRIADNAILSAVDGLQSLLLRPPSPGPPMRTVSTGRLIIADNPSLTSLEGLRSLEAIGTLILENNDALPDLSDLSSLRGIDLLRILDNDRLVDLRGLEELESIGVEICPRAPASGRFEIRGNDQLRSLDGLDNLRRVNRFTLIADNPSLSSIEALSSLQEPGNCGTLNPGLNIVNNDALTNLDGVSFTGSSVRLRDNDALVDISALSSLVSTPTLSIENNDALVDLTGLGSLMSASELNIEGNDVLVDITALRSLESAFTVSIRGNDALTSVDGLESLAFVGFQTGGPPRQRRVGGLFILDNDSLENLDGLQQLGTAPDFNGFIRLEDNAALTDITGLANVERVSQLSIVNNDALTSLDGLQALRRVDRGIDGLPSGLFIQGNGSLESVAALFGLQFIRGVLRVIDNLVLPTCQVEALIAAIGVGNIGGPITIVGNDDSGVCP